MKIKHYVGENLKVSDSGSKEGKQDLPAWPDPHLPQRNKPTELQDWQPRWLGATQLLLARAAHPELHPQSSDVAPTPWKRARQRGCRMAAAPAAKQRSPAPAQAEGGSSRAKEESYHQVWNCVSPEGKK